MTSFFAKLVFVVGLISVLGVTTIYLNAEEQKHLRSSTCHEVSYQFSVFALTWIGQYCSSNSCDSNWKERWDGKSFTIHGYWPSSTDSAYIKCQSQNKKNGGYDKYCYEKYDFNQQSLSPIRTDMLSIWPQIGSIKKFWEYEWVKHGTCYLKLALKYNPFGLTQDQIYLQYFSGSLNKHKKLNLKNITKSFYNSPTELAIDIGLSESQLITICSGNSLREIRICYNLAQPGHEVPIPCPSRPSQCSFPIHLKGKI